MTAITSAQVRSSSLNLSYNEYTLHFASSRLSPHERLRDSPRQGQYIWNPQTPLGTNYVREDAQGADMLFPIILNQYRLY